MGSLLDLYVCDSPLDVHVCGSRLELHVCTTDCFEMCMCVLLDVHVCASPLTCVYNSLF